MRAFVTALMMVLLALPAYAQGRHKHRSSEQTTGHKPKVDDKAYGAALSRLPDQKYDPWKDMR